MNKKMHMATGSLQRVTNPWEVDGFVFGSVPCVMPVCVCVIN